MVGLLYAGSVRLPMVLSLRHEQGGVVIDAVLLTEDAVSILFSFTRSYFAVDVARPYDLVRFLRRLMPRKRVAELYISIGQNKHGKTERYRDLLRHLHSTDELFEHAPGSKGLVMIVFTMPGYDDVFKVIRDRFPPPKRTTRASIMDRYRMVFQHDRAGRLIDAQDFQHLQFPLDRFHPELAQELLTEAGRSVHVSGDHLILDHVYVERRVVPLDLYARDAVPAAAAAAVTDYGQAIKDLACTNIFPGDLLTKNFGVTRHGRVVFYDYDELSALTDVRFKAMPPSRDPMEEISETPWFGVDGSGNISINNTGHQGGMQMRTEASGPPLVQAGEPLGSITVDVETCSYDVDLWIGIADALNQLDDTPLRTDMAAFSFGVYDRLAHERHVFPSTPSAIEHARLHVARTLHDPAQAAAAAPVTATEPMIPAG